MSLEEATEKAKALPVAEEDIWQIAKAVDQMRGEQPEYELVASSICWTAAAETAGTELQTVLAHNLGRSLLQAGRLDESEKMLDLVEKQVRERGDRQKLVGLLGTKATLHLRRGQRDRALSLYEESFSLAEEFEDPAGSAASAFGIASICEDQGRIADALSWLRRSRAIFQSLGNRRWEFQSLRKIVRLLNAEDESEERANSLVEAVALGASIQAEPSELLPLMVSLAHQRINSGQYAEAEDELRAGLNLARESGERMLEGFFIGNLGAVYAMTNRLSEARECHESALEIAVEVGDREGAEIAATNLHRLSSKVAVAGDDPPVAFDDSLSAEERRGSTKNGTQPDVEPLATASNDPFLAAIRPEMYVAVVESYLTRPPRGRDPKEWAGQLARMMASFQFGNTEQLAECVGDSPELLHVLQEVVARIVRQEPNLKSVLMEKIQPILPSAADTDRITAEYDQLVGLAERIVLHPDEAGPILETIAESELPRDDSTAVTNRVMERIAQVEEDNPPLSYMLALALARWLPPFAAATDRFQVHQKIGILASAFRHQETAIDAYQVACDIAREASLQPEFATAATNLGTLLRRMGRTVEALGVYEAAIDSFDDDSRPDVAAMVLINAATAYSDLGQYERGRELCERAIRLLGDQKEHQGALAIAYTNLSGALSGLGDKEGAEAATLSALNIARRNGMKNQEAVALGHLGLFRIRQGRMSIGLRYLETAAEDAEALNDLWNAQNWRRDIGNYFLSLGLHDESVPHFDRALELSRKIGDRRSEGICLLGLGAAKGDDDLAEALELLRQAWDVLIETGNAYSAIDAAYHIAADLLAQAIDLDGIKDALMDATALDGFEPRKVKNPKPLSEAREWLGRAKEMMAQPGVSQDGRLATLEATILRLDGSLEEAANVLREATKIKTSLMDHCTTNLALASLLFRDMDQPANALHYYEQALAGYDAVANDLEWNERRIRFRDSISPHFGEAVQCALVANDIDLAFRFCEQARLAELRRLWKLRDQAVPFVSLTELSAALARREGTVLVEFLPAVGETIVFIVSSDRDDNPRAITIDGFGHESLGRIWLAERQAYDLARSPAAAFDQSLREHWQATVESVCDQIGSQLLAPIAAAIADLDARHVVFVPHSILHCFPLHAARLDNERWIDRYDISYLPTASAMVHATTLPSGRDRAFVGFADSMQDLPMTRVEVARAARHFPKSSATFCGTEVTHERVMSSITDANVIHFACHAKQELDDSLSTSIYLHDQDETDQFGAALDLYTLNRDVVLQDGTVVVLSGCESGTVTPRLSGEVISLAGGFLTAGAKIVISSLWKVRDACAVLLVDRFYANLAARQMKPGAALKNAQLYVRSITEDDAFAALEEMIQSSGFDNRESLGWLLEPYKDRRQDVFPFWQAADWAAFFVTGIE